MKRSCFFSFHYVPDCSRAAQVRNMGALEGNAPVSDNDWESVKRDGDAAIERWIKGQMTGRASTVVLVGTNTAGRKWINYEIQESWKAGKGLVGIHIHGLKDLKGVQSLKGGNPFLGLMAGYQSLSSIVKLYDTPYTTSTYVYDYIKENIAKWIEEAIQIRNRY
jgi:hypothetical protein